MMGRVSATIRTASPETSPAAVRPGRSLWRDPRLVVGVLLVAGSVVLGARLLAHADDSVTVWALRHDVGEGSRIGPDDVVLRHIRFFDAADADRYVSGNAVPRPGSVVTRDLGAGELLPRAALGTDSTRPAVEVPFSVAGDALPASVRPGSVVDVWVTPGQSTAAAGGDGGPLRSVRVFDDVTVVAAPSEGTALGPSSTRQLVIAVPPDKEAGLPGALARAATGTVVVVKQDGH